MDSADIKVVLLGEVNAGKTSVFIRFFENTWNRQYNKSTIGFSYKSIQMTSNTGAKYAMGVWDTAGSERYASLSTMYYRDADCAILCLDPSNDRSWEKVKYWTEEVRKVVPDCALYICATKKDLFDVGKIKFIVDKEELYDFVKEIGAKYIEVSSKNGENIHQLFQVIVNDCSRNLVFNDKLRNRRIENQSNISLSHDREQLSREYRKSESCC